MSNSELDEDLSDHLYVPCGKIISKFKPEQLVMTCDSCDRFFARCCQHMHKICHSSPVVYTDGACSNNGRSGAMAGIGVAFGTNDGDPEEEDGCQFSILVDDRLDPGGKRTSQRAELLAALEGLKKVYDHKEMRMLDHSSNHDSMAVFITTDSEYVVKGMSEWLPNWKRNGLRKTNGQRPSNLDLFCKLDAEIEKRERRHNCGVVFWHVDRSYNTIVDRLAKRGARVAADTADGYIERTIHSVRV